MIPEIVFIHDKTFQNASAIEALITQEAQYFADPKYTQKNIKIGGKKYNKPTFNSDDSKKKSRKK